MTDKSLQAAVWRGRNKAQGLERKFLSLGYVLLTLFRHPVPMSDVFLLSDEYLVSLTTVEKRWGTVEARYFDSSRPLLVVTVTHGFPAKGPLLQQSQVRNLGATLPNNVLALLDLSYLPQNSTRCYSGKWYVSRAKLPLFRHSISRPTSSQHSSLSTSNHLPTHISITSNLRLQQACSSFLR